MADDLNAPLGMKAGKFDWRRIPFGLVGVALLVAFVAGVSTWTVFFPDPLGGEPTALARLERGKVGAADIGIGVAPQDAAGAARAGDGKAAEEGHASSGDAVKRPGMPAEGQPLPSTPIAKVTDKGRFGPLPKVGPDGTRPLEVYARPAPRRPAATPRVVIVVGGIGLSQTATQEAIRVLPPEVTFAFAPYGSSLDRWMTRARQEGHELLLQMPMEPFDYPDNDPGPHTLLTTLPPEQNLDRMQWVLGRTTNYVGVVGYMGGKLTADEAKLSPLLKELAGRGIMYLDDASSGRSLAEQVARQVRLPFARADVVIDQTTTEAAIDARLTQLESLARSRGLAIGYATALPISLRKIGEWTKTLDARGIVLVPVSAAARDGQSG